MNSGVRKSGWPMPRLMMSRPCAISALARASTAKAFSSPIRSKAALVRSMMFPRRFLVIRCRAAFFRLAVGASIAALRALSDLEFGHAHDLEDDGDRPSDEQQPVERHDRPKQPISHVLGQRIAIAERGIVLEREF